MAGKNRCWLFHDWSKWGAPVFGNVLSDGKRVGDYIAQRRECQRCGAIKQRLVQG